MDKRLIDADRFLTYINSIRNAHIEKRNEGDECDQFANDAVIDWLFLISNDIEKGIFDAYSDPIPLPTINPGDKVRHNKYGDATVIALDQYDANAVIIDCRSEMMIALKEDLEVSHD